MKSSIVVPLSFGALAACGGGASVEGDIGGLSFELVTVYGWIDATEAEGDPAAGKVIFKPRARKDLHIVLSGASYDPEFDLRFSTAAEILDIGLQETQNGMVDIEVRDFDAVAVGTQLSQPDMSGDGPDLDVNHRFAAIRLDGDAVYPSEAALFGSRTTYRLTFDEVGRVSGESVSGTLVIAVERADGDPPVVHTGAITIGITAPLIGERIAECNTSGGRSQSCELTSP